MNIDEKNSIKKRKLEKSPQKVQSGSLVVSTRQKGNPLLASLRNVPYTFSEEILADYQIGASTVCLFLSIAYHRLHPNYIYDRLKSITGVGSLRVLLVQVDVPDSASYLEELSRVAILSSCSLVLAWSETEAARYVEAFKIYENKPADMLQGRKDSSYLGTINRFLTSIKGVNKTDVARLRDRYGTIKAIAGASNESLSAVPGIGPKKAAKIHQTFNRPFKSLDPFR